MEIENKHNSEKFGICPYVTAQKVLQGKWAILILCQLENGPVRFNELLRRIEIAQGTLSNQLKCLEDDGLVRRNVCTDGTLKVEYELTEIGREFKPVLDSIERWGEKYIEYLKETGKECVHG